MMQQSHRYFLLSDTHRQQLLQRLESSLQAWGETWFPAATDVRKEAKAAVVVTTAWSAHAGAEWIAVASGERILGWFRLAPDEAGNLLDFAAGGHGAETGTLAKRLGRQIALDLCGRICRTDAARPPSELALSGAPDPALFDKGADAVGLLITFRHVGIWFLIPGESFQSFAPGPTVRAAPQQPLGSVGKAIDGQPMQIRAVLEVPGGVLLDEIEDLAEGHVLMLDQLPWAEWTLFGPDGARLGSCRPGRSGDHIAVQLVSAAKG